MRHSPLQFPISTPWIPNVIPAVQESCDPHLRGFRYPKPLDSKRNPAVQASCDTHLRSFRYPNSGLPTAIPAVQASCDPHLREMSDVRSTDDVPHPLILPVRNRSICQKSRTLSIHPPSLPDLPDCKSVLCEGHSLSSQFPKQSLCTDNPFVAGNL